MKVVVRPIGNKRLKPHTRIDMGYWDTFQKYPTTSIYTKVSVVRAILPIRKLPHFHLRTCEKHFHNMYVSTTLSYDDDKVKDFSFTANTHRGIATGKKSSIFVLKKDYRI